MHSIFERIEWNLYRAFISVMLILVALTFPFHLFCQTHIHVLCITIQNVQLNQSSSFIRGLVRYIFGTADILQFNGMGSIQPIYID